MCGSSQRKSLELIAMCPTKKDIFIGQSSGNDGSSNLQVLRGHWASNGHHTALRTANQDLEPSFLRSFHLESCMPLLSMERDSGSRIRFPVLANSSASPSSASYPGARTPLKSTATLLPPSSSCSSNQRPVPLLPTPPDPLHQACHSSPTKLQPLFL